MRLNFWLICAFVIFPLASFSQTIEILNEDFEGPSNVWSTTGNSGSNQWIINTCAGNGPSAAGSKSVYITKGGAIAGCGTTGDIQYRYADAAAGSEFTIVFTTVNASCLENLEFTIDYKLIGEGYNGASGPFHDFGQIVYSTDGGTTWTNATNEFYNIPSWSTVTLPLPSILNGQSFEFGILWTFDNSLINDPPLSIDNISITGEDNTAPTVTCQGAINVPVNSLCQTTLLNYSNTLVVNDACTPTGNFTITQTPAPGTIISQASNPHSISFLVEDENGNSSTCAFNLTLIDTIKPNISCPGNQQVNLNTSCSYSVTDFSTTATITDNCSALGNMTIVQNPSVGTVLSNHGTIQSVSILATDASGNSRSCSFNIELIDASPPALTCPSNASIYANATCDATIPNYTGVVVSTDNCTSSGLINLVQSPLPGNIISGIGANQLITITGTDLVGNSSQCTFTISLVDTIKPSLTCPPNQTINGDASCSAITPNFSSLVSASDNCSSAGNLTYTQNPLAGSTISGPVNTVNVFIQDEAGNTKSCNFVIRVIDIFPPSITCPSNQNLFLNGNCESSLVDYSSLTLVADNCLSTPQLSITQSPVAGTILPGSLGNQIVTMFVADTSGNTNQCQFTVSLLDTIAPIINCPADSIVYVNNSCEYSVANYTSGASVSDNCSAPSNVLITQNISPGTILNSGIHPLTLTATDANGNSRNCVFNLIVRDSISPTFTICPASVSIQVNANCQATLINYTGQTVAIDNCPGAITYTQSPPAGTLISSNSNVAIEAIDLSGNSAFCFVQVNLNDTIPPNIVVCPGNQIVNVNAACEYIVGDYLSFTSATDNCTSIGNLVITQSPAAGTTATGNSIVTITVTDENGNSSNCNFNLLVQDNTPPTITTCVPNQPAYVNASCEFVLPNYTGAVIASDVCGPVTLTQSPIDGTVLNAGISTIYIIARDSSGNLDSCQFDLTLLDTISPAITCIPDFETCDSIVVFSDPVNSDNCGLVTLTRTDLTGLLSGAVFPTGTTTIAYQVEDNSGNTAACSFDVTVIAVPDNANAGTNLNLCEIDSVVLSANTPLIGSGSWTIISGPGTLDDFTNPNTTIRNLVYGETILTWQITNQICQSNADTLRINMYQNPSISIVVDTIHTCGDTVTLYGNNPTIGLGTWTNILGSANISQVNFNQSFASNLFIGSNLFVWTISNGSCLATKDTLVVISNNAPTVIDGGGNQSLCDTTTQINLVAIQPDYGTGIWSVIQGNGILDYDTALSVHVSAINLNPNTLTWTVSKAHCPDQIDTISINYYSCIPFDFDVPTAFTPNGDGINDTWIIPNLNKYYPNCKVLIVNRWGNTVFQSDGYTDPWDGRHKGEILPFASYYFVIDFNNDSDKPLSGSITIIK